MKADFIRKIQLKKKNSWHKKIFLTFDMDWAPDYIMEYFLEFIEKKKISSTLFVTHNLKTLNDLKKNKLLSLEIHPNFNHNLEKNISKNNYKIVLKKMLKLVPDAKVVRSHCLTQSSKILLYCKELGLTHDSNDIVFGSNQKVHPWKHFTGLFKIPITWEDDIHLYLKQKKSIRFKQTLLFQNSLNVFSFHPTSLFVNSNNFKQHSYAMKMQSNYKIIKSIINFKKYGILNFIEDLINQNFK